MIDNAAKKDVECEWCGRVIGSPNVACYMLEESDRNRARWTT